MTIIIDSREPKDLIDKLKEKINDVEVEFLEVGDVLLSGDYVIERKHHDIIQSLTTKRIFSQLNELCNTGHPILCIINENIWKDFYHCKSSWIDKSYEGFLTTLATSYPTLKVFFFTDMKDYINFIVALDKKIHKEGSSSRPSPIARKPKSMQERKENMLCMIEGIGIPKSKLLLEKYKNIYDLCSANMIELKKVKGIGPKLADVIYKTLH